MSREYDVEKKLVTFSRDLGESWLEELSIKKAREHLFWTIVFFERVPRDAKVTVRLCGPESGLTLHLLFIGRGEEALNIEIAVRHEAPQTLSRVHARSALFERSRLSCRGLIRIEPEARHADAYLEGRALLLSPTAIAQILPYLEIEAHEVRASHGASVGRPHDQHLFYLRSRGLDIPEAHGIILEDYFAKFFPHLPPSVAAAIRSSIAENSPSPRSNAQNPA